MKDDGGSLYPTDTAAGMSVRDYFASDQTAALLSRLSGELHTGMLPSVIPKIVELGYEAADEMLKQRANWEKGKQPGCRE